MSAMFIPDDDPLVRKALIDSGWTPERAEDTTVWAQLFEEEGYGRNEDVLDILKSLGHLAVVPPTHPGQCFSSGPVVFDPVLANERHLIRELEKHLRMRLWPIGEWYGVYLLLYAEDGSVYADGASLGVKLVGKTFADALRLLIKADRRTETVIPVGEHP